MTDERREIVSIIAHTALDLVAILALTVLICLDKIPAEWGLAMIALIVGIWGGKLKNGSMRQPPTGLVLGAVMPAINMFRSKGLL